MNIYGQHSKPRNCKYLKELKLVLPNEMVYSDKTFY